MTTSTSTSTGLPEPADPTTGPPRARSSRGLVALSTELLKDLAKPEGHGHDPMPPRWWERFDYPGTHQRDHERRSTG